MNKAFQPRAPQGAAGVAARGGDDLRGLIAKRHRQAPVAEQRNGENQTLPYAQQWFRAALVA